MCVEMSAVWDVTYNLVDVSTFRTNLLEVCLVVTIKGVVRLLGVDDKK